MSHAANDQTWFERVVDGSRRRSTSMDEYVAPKSLQQRFVADPDEFAAIIIGASLLSFNAGFINGVVLLSSGITVSHVTGIITKSGLFLASGELSEFIHTLAILPFYIIRSTISSVLNPYQSFHLGRAYNKIFIIGTFLLIIAIILEFTETHNLAYAYVASIVCGMQNAMSTKYSNNVLRTTHMTGTATDIGIVLGLIIRGKYDESWRLALLIPLMFSFFLGGVCGGLAFVSVGRYALFFNILLFGGTGLLYAVYIAHKTQVSVIKAVFMNNFDLKDIRGIVKRMRSPKQDDAAEEPVANPLHSTKKHSIISTPVMEAIPEENDNDMTVISRFQAIATENENDRLEEGFHPTETAIDDEK